MEFVVNGHSDEPIGNFMVPQGFQLKFYSGKGEVCYMTPSGLVDGINYLKNNNLTVETINQYQNANDYYIFFEQSIDSTQGVLYIDVNNNGENEFKIIYINNLPQYSGSYKLSDIVEYIRQITQNFAQNNNFSVVVYCIFCRGNKNEFSSMDFGVNENHANQYIQNLINSVNAGGAKRKSYKRKKKNKRKTKKNIRKMKQKTRKYNIQKK